MRKTRTLGAFIFIFTLFFSASICFAQDFHAEYLLLDRNNVTYNLNIVIPNSLQEYYAEKNHRVFSPSEFSSFVTPYVFEPIAERLWEIYSNNEDFANGVLAIVHQIDYEETSPVKYPIETLVDGRGDCDLFSLIAASIAKAGGLDVVLLYYEQQAHMNIGIHLSTRPHDARDDPCYVTFEDKRYYMAECTGENWMEGWRVGECPPDLNNVNVEVISLEEVELVAPGQVSASFNELEASSILLDLSPTISLQDTNLLINGVLSPHLEWQQIIIYSSSNNSPWTEIAIIQTDSDGIFQYLWETEFSGSISVQASWAGNSQFSGTVSSTKTAFIIPSVVIQLILLCTIIGIAGCILLVIVKRTQIQEIQPEYWDYE